MKYIFTDQNYKPICIAFYVDDAVAIKEADRLAKEMQRVVYVCRHLAILDDLEIERTAK
jgi:hypothetical protein